MMENTLVTEPLNMPELSDDYSRSDEERAIPPNPVFPDKFNFKANKKFILITVLIVLSLMILAFLSYAYFTSRDLENGQVDDLNNLISEPSPEVIPTENPKAEPESVATKSSLLNSPSPTLPIKKPTQAPVVKTSPMPTTTPKPIDYSGAIIIEKGVIDLETKYSQPVQISVGIKNLSNTNLAVHIETKNCVQSGQTCPVQVKSPAMINANQSTSIVFEGKTDNFTPSKEVSFDFKFYDSQKSYNGAPKYLVTKTIKVNLITLVNPSFNVESNYDGKAVADHYLNLKFKPHLMTPIMIKNNHSYGLRWSAKIINTDNQNNIVYPDGFDSGWLPAGDSWHTEMRFLDTYTGPSIFQVEYLFTDSQDKLIESKILTVNVAH